MLGQSHDLLECIRKGQSSIINIIANCCLFSKLSWKMPVWIRWEMCGPTSPFRRLFLHISMSVFIGPSLVFCAAMQFKRQEIFNDLLKRNAEKSRNEKRYVTEHQVEMLWTILFSLLLIVHAYKNAKGLEWISSILFNNISNENATARAEMFRKGMTQQQKHT